MANIYVAAQSTWNGKALKKAKKDITVFDQQVKTLGKTFAGVFGARALFNYGKNAVKAFAADEAAAKALELQLKNTGNQFSAPAVEMYIANLQKTTGVIDDQLRPAFQQLLTVTKSVELSQAALDTALNVSAATGKSVVEVTAALSKGYAGNTTALTRLGAGLDKTTLKGGDMNKILDDLNKKFAGQAQARLGTYAGKLDLINVAAANAKETIGKGLLDALTIISKDKSISNLTGDFEKLSAGIAGTIVDLANLISKLQQIPGLSFVFDVKNIPVVGSYLDYLMGRGGQAQTFTGTPFGQAGSSSEAARLAEQKRIKDAAKLRATENALIKEKNALEDLKKKYDVERINLMAALNNATDEETRVRLAEKLAILDGNAALAKKYLADSYAADATVMLAESMNKASAAALYFSDWATYRAGERGSVSSGGSGGMSTAFSTGVTYPTLNTQNTDWMSYRAGERGDVTVNVSAEGSILTDQDLQTLIQNSILSLTKQGRGLTPAGGLSGGT
jgi:hypothetical protein